MDRRKLTALGGSSFPFESRQFFARTPGISPGRKAQYNTMIRGLVDAGVWAKLDTFYMLAAADQATALTNLVQSSYGLTVNGTPSFVADVGYTGNGTDSDLSSGFTPSTAGGLTTLNSACLFAWSNTSATSNGGIIGGIGDNVNEFEIFPRWQDGNTYWTCMDGNVDVQSGALGDAKGLWHASRTGANLSSLYRNAVSVHAANTASSIFCNDEVRILRVRPTGNGHFSTHQCLCAGWGAGMTAGEALALYNVLHTYLQEVAGIA